MTADGFGHLRVSDADRDSANAWLTTAFAQGRLTKDEYDERLGQALSAKTYGELGVLTADLPGSMPGLPAPGQVMPAVPRTNPLAVASLVCGICQLFFPPVLTILAIAFGHVSRGQIRRSLGRETGAGMAACGLVLGWLAVALVVLGIGLVFMHVAVAHPALIHRVPIPANPGPLIVGPAGSG